MPDYAFGTFAAGIPATAASDADGTTFAVTQGRYMLCVTGETVWFKRGALTIAAGEGTPLVAGTQMIVLVWSPENWAVRSLGGAGIVTLTKDRAGMAG
jgi:hypothetical protein